MNKQNTALKVEVNCEVNEVESWSAHQMSCSEQLSVHSKKVKR